jgi:hypothetical protein
MTSRPPSDSHAIAMTSAWVQRAIIDLNLCPFAKAVRIKNQIRYVVSDDTDPEDLLNTLCEEMQLLVAADPEAIDTTLIIHPRVLTDFLDYNDFLDQADAAVVGMGLDGVLQVASFHPDYQFDGTDADDPENASNRSPYPTLHLLREASVDRAVAAFPDAEAIYETNIANLKALGSDGWAAVQAQIERDATLAGPGVPPALN